MTGKMKYSLVFLLFLVCGPSRSLAQPARETVSTLKNLETKVATGISYSDYASDLAEARFSVRLFLDSPDARNNPELAAALTSVLQQYETALDVWADKHAGRGVTDIITDGYFRSSYYRCVNDYKAASVSSRNFITGEMTYAVEITDCLSRIWGKASEALKTASITLSHIEKTAQAPKVEIETDALFNIEKKALATNIELETIKKEIERIKADYEKLRDENSKMQQEVDNLKKETATLLSKPAVSPRKKKKKK